MKRSRFTETQILNILKLQESGLTVDEISRQNGISPATFYNWKKKYSGMEASELRKLKHMESELAQFKRMYAELARENDALKDLIEKKL